MSPTEARLKDVLEAWNRCFSGSSGFSMYYAFDNFYDNPNIFPVFCTVYCSRQAGDQAGDGLADPPIQVACGAAEDEDGAVEMVLSQMSGGNARFTPPCSSSAELEVYASAGYGERVAAEIRNFAGYAGEG